MEKTNSSSENDTDQLIMSADHSSDNMQLADHASQSSSAVRSYECTFCKRGFSNAQALGGHMNIHRKDKAKLKQATFSIHETKQKQQESSEISKIQSINPSYSSPINPPLFNYLVDDQDKDQLEFAGIDHDHKVQLRESRKGLSSSAGRSSSDSEILDLELRLGPHEPPADSSSSATATRKFF